MALRYFDYETTRLLWRRMQHILDRSLWWDQLLSVLGRSLTKKKLYASLPLTADSDIRILILYPGRADDRIVCGLQNMPLKAELGLNDRYEALSYVWGETEHQTPILVNRCRTNITANLYNALLQLRSRDHVRRLWVDALCIHQDSTTERNHQVRQMTSIYNYAQQVLIWLGTCDDDATLSNIGFLQRRVSHINDRPKVFRSGYELQQGGAALVRMLQRDWFCRICTKQELAVSSETRVLVGKASFEWGTFASWVVSLHLLIEQSEIDLVSGYVDMKDQYEQCKGMPLYHLLYRNRDAQASEPRDKIYALLGMSTAPKLEDFPLDYNLDVPTVCRRTVLSLIAAEGNLRPLVQWCERTLRLPSWVPDYTSWRSDFVARPLTNPLDKPVYCASGNFFDKMKARPGSQSDQLYVTGVVFDTVDSVRTQNWWEFGQESTQPQQSRVALNDLRQSLDRSKALWHTLIAGWSEEGGSLVDYFGITGTHVEWSDYLLGRAGRVSLPYYELDIIQHCVAVMKARSVFFTATGFTGIGPRSLQKGASTVQKGDVVAILYGGEVPYILRPHGGWYELIGECYVSGIMQGEFMDLYEKHKGEPGCPEEQDFELR